MLLAQDEAKLQWLDTGFVDNPRDLNIGATDAGGPTILELSCAYLADYAESAKSKGPKRINKLKADHLLMREFLVLNSQSPL